MTNDKDCAALFREAEKAAKAWRVRCSTDPSDGSMCKPKDDCVFGYTQGYSAALQMFAEALDATVQSHGQAFDAAGVTQWMRSEGYAQVQITLRSDGGHEIDCRKSPLMIRKPNGGVAPLVIPEAPASVEPVGDDVRRLVIAARKAWEELINSAETGFNPDDLDKALEAFSSRVPYEDEPDTIGWNPTHEVEDRVYPHDGDTIGSHFGNGGGLDPVGGCDPIGWMWDYRVRFRDDGDDWSVGHMGRGQPPADNPDYRNIVPLYEAPPSPGFGGGDLREAESSALRIGWWNDMRARGVSQDDAIAKINAALAALPPVKQSVGEG